MWSICTHTIKTGIFYCCCRCMESMFQLMTPSIFRCSKTSYCAFLEFKFKRHLFYDLILLTKPARDTTLLSVAFSKEMFDDGRSFVWLRKYCFTVFWCPSTGMRCLNIEYIFEAIPQVGRYKLWPITTLCNISRNEDQRTIWLCRQEILKGKSSIFLKCLIFLSKYSFQYLTFTPIVLKLGTK